MDSGSRLHEGRLFAGKTEGGMGPRIREDKGGEGDGRFSNRPYGDWWIEGGMGSRLPGNNRRGCGNNGWVWE